MAQARPISGPLHSALKDWSKGGQLTPPGPLRTFVGCHSGAGREGMSVFPFPIKMGSQDVQGLPFSAPESKSPSASDTQPAAVGGRGRGRGADTGELRASDGR